MKLYPFTIIARIFGKDEIKEEHSFQKSIQQNDIVSKDLDFEEKNFSIIYYNSDLQSKQQFNNLQSNKDSEESKLIMHSESSTNDSQNYHSNQNQSNFDQNISNMLSNDDPKVDQLENSISDSNSSSIDIQGQIENQQKSQTISQEKSEIIQEEQVNSQEKPTVLKEDPTVLQEMPTVLKEDTTTLQEKQTISKEKPVNQQKRSKTKYTHKLKYYHRYIPLRGNRRCIEITMFPEINVIPPQNPSSIPPPNMNQEDGNNSGN